MSTATIAENVHTVLSCTNYLVRFKRGVIHFDGQGDGKQKAH